MGIWQKIKDWMIRFMQGRYGSDNLGMVTLIAGLICSVTGSLTRWGILSFLGLALYIVTLFRMFSRNREARLKENRKYIELTGEARTRVTQWARRMKNRKDYKYFKCPNCKVLLRLRRGCGEKDITCVRCGHHFRQKA